MKIVYRYGVILLFGGGVRRCVVRRFMSAYGRRMLLYSIRSFMLFYGGVIRRFLLLFCDGISRFFMLLYNIRRFFMLLFGDRRCVIKRYLLFSDCIWGYVLGMLNFWGIYFFSGVKVRIFMKRFYGVIFLFLLFFFV